MRIQPSSALSETELAQLVDLERRTVAVDGGRLELEWGVLRDRYGPDVHDLLAWDGDGLIGFCRPLRLRPPDRPSSCPAFSTRADGAKESVAR